MATNLKQVGVSLLMLFVLIGVVHPGNHHVHHRIHVPTKIKTVFLTKIIKVPEHHHYIQEKETIKFVDLHELHKKNFDDDDQFGLHKFEWHKDLHDAGDLHNIFKKHATIGPARKKIAPKRTRE